MEIDHETILFSEIRDGRASRQALRLIADSVLDDCLKEDPDSRVVCEVLATKGRIIVAGEITSRHNPNVSEIVKGVLEDVGYSLEEIQIDVFLHKQSPDIAEAVAYSLEYYLLSPVRRGR